LSPLPFGRESVSDGGYCEKSCFLRPESHHCLSAGSPFRTGARRCRWNTRNSVTIAFRQGVRFGRAWGEPAARLGDGVTIAFRQGVRFGRRNERHHIYHHHQSPLPFGRESVSDGSTRSPIPCPTESHHCLSAGSPFRTTASATTTPTVKTGHHCLSAGSPFRTPIYTNSYGLLRRRHHCLSAGSPFRTDARSRSLADNVGKSPLPFGRESVSDCRDGRALVFSWQQLVRVGSILMRSFARAETAAALAQKPDKLLVISQLDSRSGTGEIPASRVPDPEVCQTR
jgi:hypothetical protein